MFPYIEIFGLTLPSYTLLSLLGGIFAIGYVLLMNQSGRCGKLPTEDFVYILMLGAVGVLVGGKVLYVLVTLPQLLQMGGSAWQNPLVALSLLFGGMVFYGGLFGAFFSTIWYCRRFKISLRLVAGVATPAIPLFHTFGRTGCFSVGCCWGLQWPFGYVFHHSPVAPNGLTLFPTQLTEAVINAVLFVLLLFLALHWGENNAWKTFPLYLLLYSVLRFVLEFFRADTIRGVWLFSTSQWVSIGIWIGLAVWFCRYYAKRTSQ